MADSDKKKQEAGMHSRRELLVGTVALGLGGVIGGVETAGAKGHAADDAISVAVNGKYVTAPLRQRSINVSAIQSRVRAVDVRNLQPTLQANLRHVTELIDYARIPIADFRETRGVREIPAALFRPILEQYEPRFKPNAFLDKLPETYKEAGQIVRERMQGG